MQEEGTDLFPLPFCFILKKYRYICRVCNTLYALWVWRRTWNTFRHSFFLGQNITSIYGH